MSQAPSATRVELLAERLYALVPSHIRTVDADNGLALKAFFEVVASGAAEIDVEIDGFYEALFVETAPEGALAAFGALVAAEPLQPLPPEAGQNARAFIANTIRYRRGKGTARVLETLARDVTGLGAVAVEYFQRLARLQHLIDVRPERPGTAFLVPGESAARVARAFDRLPRLVDVRSIARAAGRHHVPHIGVHLVRPVVPVFPAPPGTALAPGLLAGVPLARPWPTGGGGGGAKPGYFQLAAQAGRALRLFNPDRRSADSGERTVEVDLPDRLRRLPLHLETEELRRAALEGRSPALGALPWFDAEGQPFTVFLRRTGETTFTRVPPAEVQIANLDVAPPVPGARPAASKSYTWVVAGSPAAVSKTAAHPIRCGFDPVTGRLIVATPAAGEPETEEVRVAYGYGIGQPIGAGPQERNDASVPFDLTDTPALRHFIRIVDATAPETGAATDPLRFVKSLAKALVEWASSGKGKRGVIVLVRCDREGGGAPFVAKVHPGSELHIVSAEWRPKRTGPGIVDVPARFGYVVRRDRRFTVDARLDVQASGPPAAGEREGILVLDGLELTSGIALGAKAVSRLQVRYCTVRNPGAAAIGTAAALQNAAIVVDHCVVGPIALDGAGATASGSIEVLGSVLSRDGAAMPVLAATKLDAVMRNATLFGTASVKSLEADNVIFVEPIAVTRRQSGCVRFSFVPTGSTVPRRYRCQPDLAVAAAAEAKGAPLTPAEAHAAGVAVTPLFLDTALDEPTVALLHPLCAREIRSGGENGSEMGVFSVNGEEIRRANLVSLFSDYLPFGLEAGLIDDTSSSAVATRRDRP